MAENVRLWSGKESGKGKNEISKEVLLYLLVGGAVTLALSTAPYLLVAAIPIARFQRKQYSKRELRNSFYYLRRKNLISVESRKGNMCIALTEKGRKRAFKQSILTSVRVGKPARWDGKWRLVLFDIQINHKIKRDALRHMLSKIGFVQLQKSVWVYPFDCREAVDQLKEFFGLHDEACRFVVSNDIGGDRKFRKHFGV